MSETNFSTLIANAVAAKLTPDFIEKEVDSRVEKLLIDSINSALRSYSDTGKLIEAAVADALRVNKLDLPFYGEMVARILKTQIEARVSEVVSGRLAEDMADLLSLAPKEVKLSEIAEEMRKQYEGEAYGEVITVIIDDDYEPGRLAWVYLDDEQAEKRKFDCKYSMLISADARIAGARIGKTDMKKVDFIGRFYGLDQKLRAYMACGTKIIMDVDAVVTSVGAY